MKASDKEDQDADDQVREYAGRREGGGEAGFFGAHGQASYNVPNSPFVHIFKCSPRTRDEWLSQEAAMKVVNLT